jgi:glycosyltransferase involved in cell wall biosynthesis
MKKPMVSVIVTTRNSEKHIKNCLMSIKKQTYPSVETILVDNYSKDDTVKIANKIIKSIYIKGPERSAQRNYGVSKSKGEYILFLDSDMQLGKKVLEECINKMISSDIRGIYIPERIQGSGYFSKVRNFERGFYNETAIDAVRFIKKSDYLKIGGFDETLFAGEDWDFNIRIKKLGKTAIIKSSLNHDESGFSLTEYVAKKAYYSPNLVKYKTKWRQNKDVHKQFSVYYRYFSVFVEKNKWKRLILNPHLTIGMFFLRFIVGLTYLISRRK